MSEVIVEKNVHHLLVKINRPEKHNAFTPDVIRQLTEIFRLAGHDRDARAVVLRGMGASFSAGGDLEWMKSMAKYKFEENLRDAEQLFNMFETIAECPLPVLGYIQGHAFGGGVGLAAVCDIAVAEESALFCFSEGRLGLVPAVISSFVAAKMHKNKMREYMLTARVFNAHQAHDAGLVEFVGRELESKEFFQQTLDAICNEGPEAVRETKKLLGFLRHHPKAAIKSESVRVIAERRVSAEGQEGIASFLAKRKPAWVK